MMSDNLKQVEGEADLARDINSTAIINRNKSAYEMAKRRSEQARKKLLEEEEQRDTIRNATREINTLKSEMHEIKNLLQQLVDK
jgi:predicted RNase H-like nuclease (RuvC/YqgF family)